MIERYLIRYFLAVVDSGNFSRAAAEVAVSQPTLSVGIGRLEELLGARLFQRSNREVRLTEAGSRLLAHARAIEKEFNLAAAQVAGRQAARRIRLGVLATLPSRWLAMILDAHARAGGIDHLELVEGNERALATRLERGRIDLAITLRRSGSTRFAHESLLVERYAAILPAQHRLARMPSIEGAALRDETMIVRRHCEALAETSRYFIERSVRPRFSLRTTSDDRALALIAAGGGVTVMPMGFGGGPVAAVPLEGFELARDIGIQFARHADDLHADPVVATLRDLFGRLAG